MYNFAIQTLSSAVINGENRNYNYYHNYVLFDTLTPDNYAWCDGYSEKIYYLLRYYSGTDYYPFYKQIDSTSTIGNENPNIDSGIYSLDNIHNINYEIPQTAIKEKIIITWMEREIWQRDDLPDNYNNFITKSEFTKRYLVIETSTDTDIQIHSTINFDTFLMFSVVIDASPALKADLESQLNAVSFGLCYKYLDDYIDLIHSHINTNFPRLFFVPETITYNQTSWLNPNVYGQSLGIQSSNVTSAFHYNYREDITNVTWRSRPNYYYSASLIRANNPYWGNTIKSNIGKTITFDSMENIYILKPENIINKSIDVGLKGKPLNTGWHKVEAFSLYTSIDTYQWHYFFKFMPYSVEQPPTFLYNNAPSEMKSNYLGFLDFQENHFYSYQSLNGLWNDATQRYSGLLKNVTGKTFIANHFLVVSQGTGNIRDNYLWKIKGKFNTNAYDASNNLSGLTITQDELIFLGRTNTGYILNDVETGTYTVTYHYYNDEADYVWGGRDYGGNLQTQITDSQYISLLDNEKYKLFNGELSKTMPDSLRAKEDNANIKQLMLDMQQYKGVLGSATFKADQDAGNNPKSIYETVVENKEVLGVVTFKGQQAQNLTAKNIYERLITIDYAFDIEKYSKDENNPSATRVVNLGWLIEKIGLALGLSFESNGAVRSIRQKAVIKAGQPLPNGWKYGQFGINQGGQYQKGISGNNPQGERLGIVYECRANQLIPDPSGKGGYIIAEGDNVLCENILQYLDEQEDDRARATGWDEMGAIAVPSADGKKTAVFEGLTSMIVEILYMLSAMSENTSQTHIATLINQAVTQEILKQQGLPIVYKSFEVDVGTAVNGRVPYPAIKENVPSQYEQFSMILQNIGLLIGDKLRGGDDSFMEASNVDSSPPSSTPIPPQFIQKP